MTCDDPQVEALIAAHRQHLTALLLADAAVAAATCCLALGGGYGRGEGGVVEHADGRRTPHNDYDLVLVHRGAPTHALRTWCQAVHAQCSPRFGVHVDVTLLAAERLHDLPHSLTWYEFGQGHQVWWGEAAVLAPLRVRRLDQVDAWEWGRLLMNRAAGVAFARWRRQGEPLSLGADEDSATFATRQIEKAWLALGDVWLADHGRYHDRLAVRRTAWASCPGGPAWVERWHQAAAYKRRPRTLPAATVEAELAALAPLLAAALGDHPCAPTQALRDVLRTLRRVPPGRWLRRAPWRPLRDRVRVALMEELRGHPAACRRLVGTPEEFLHLWRTVA